ncbi:PAS domain S-box protein, partial [Pseudomonas sp. FW215-R3]|uniref:PAS domain S-box protein n=1 Tax=Pseudomonas sp. FW215-R3 TaxID=2070671 RepID=UPI001C471AD4
MRSDAAAFEVISEHTGDLFVETDINGVIKYISNSNRNYGFSAPQLVGTDALWLVHPEEQESFVRNFARILR